MNRFPMPALGCWMMLLVLAWPGPGAAAYGDDDPLLRQIEDLRSELNYEKALELAQKGRQKARDKDLSVTLSLYEGILLYELHRKDEAQEAFLRAFRLRPQAQLPTNVAPQIKKDAERSRQEVLKAAPDADVPRVVEKKRPVEKKSAPEESPAEAQKLEAPAPAPSQSRQWVWIPALTGGALVLTGGLSLAQGSAEPAGPLQTVGAGLVGAGVVSLAIAAGMYLKAPRAESSAIWLSTDGNSAILCGRWP